MADAVQLQDFESELRHFVAENPELIGIISNSSFRKIEWFLTRFAIRSPIEVGFHQDIGAEYRNQMLKYGKRYFDPFKRTNKIAIDHNGVQFETSIGQLNFFRWAYMNGVLDYVNDNIELITQEMNTALHLG